MSLRAIGFAALCAVVCGLMAVAMLTNIVSLTTTAMLPVQNAPHMLRVTRQQHFSLFEICRETSTARVCPPTVAAPGNASGSASNATAAPPTTAAAPTAAACTPSTFAQTTEECTPAVDDECRKVYFRTAIICCVVTIAVAILVGCGAACADCHSRLQTSGAIALAAAALALLVCQLVLFGVLMITREKECGDGETVDDADEVEYGPMPVLLLLAACGTLLMLVVAAICPGRQPRSTGPTAAKSDQRKRSTSKTAPRYAHQEPVSGSDDEGSDESTTADEAPAAADHAVVNAEPSSTYGAPPPQGADTTYTSRQLEFEDSTAQPHTATRRRCEDAAADDRLPANPITQALPPVGDQQGGQSQPERPGGFGPEWRWAREHGLWWSDQEELYYDAQTTHYCDPRSQMWFDPDAQEWFDPRPGQADAPERSPRESRSATMSGSRPMPTAVDDGDGDPHQQQQQRHMSFGTIIDVESVASTPAEHDEAAPTPSVGAAPSAEAEPALPDGMDRGDWVWAGEWGLWWSAKEALYFDAASLFYFDPPSGQWYNSDAGEWFEPPAEDSRRLPEGPPESRPLPPAALPTKGEL
jgi:hypothetical protein